MLNRTLNTGYILCCFINLKKKAALFAFMLVSLPQMITKMAKLALNKFTQIWDEQVFSPKGQLGTERCEGHVNIEKDFS